MLAGSLYCAGGFQLNEHGARGVERGGVCVARPFDVSAIFINPAFLTNIFKLKGIIYFQMTDNPSYTEPAVNLSLALEHGLSREEFEKIISILGRIPTYTELGIFSVMWSEHCSYKNSLALLKTLPRTGENLLAAAGEENAGLVDIGDGLAVAFKIESHNHPSAVEPYQGAATGVGGILRDIFTMGARPVAILNSLRFGELTDERSRYLFRRVVKGIGDYGNCFGVPTVAGEVYFEKCYRSNPLVNAMAVGIVEKDKIARAVAKGVGNSVMIVGSATGRDGIHGATFASEEISEASESKRPSVQVGDPFTEKLLLEATLEAIETGSVVGIQDMGAAGITCSTSEMSAKGKVGMRINLDRVPLREEKMNSYEIMLSESQERMLLVVKKGSEKNIQTIFSKWDLQSTIIGEVEAENFIRVYQHGKQVADIPAWALVSGEGAPVYVRESKAPAYLHDVRSFNVKSLPFPNDLNVAFLNLLRSPNIASKSWVYDQYDSMVRTNTVFGPGSDAAVVRIKGTRKALALKTDCNAKYVYLNPRRGAQIAVAESARNVVCTGAKPIAITNCLNFGNPYDPEVYWKFSETIAGIVEACRVLETPVTGGNVSFYNENENGAIFPTPVIGMLGIIEDSSLVLPNSFQTPGDFVILLGQNRGDLGGSEYLYNLTGKVLGDAPELNLNFERRLQYLCLKVTSERLIKSAHDVSDGGLAIAILESCLSQENILGVNINGLATDSQRLDFLLFGETQSRILVSCSQQALQKILLIADEAGIPASVLGRITADPRLKINDWIDVDVAEAAEIYYGLIPQIMGEGVV